MAGKIINGDEHLPKFPTELLIEIYKHQIFEDGNDNVVNMSVTQDYDYVYTRSDAIIAEYNKRIANE